MNIMVLKMIQDLILGEINAYFRGHKEEMALQPSGYINEFSKNDKSVKAIFDQINYKILNVSDNVELFTGYSAESLNNKTIFPYFNLIVLDHALFVYVWQNWANTLLEKYGSYEVQRHSITTMCGVKIKHKKGHIMRVMIRQTGLEFLEDGAMKISVMSCDDVSHLLKNDFYWGRTAFSLGEEKFVHHLMSKDRKDIAHDIISDREKEVLIRLANGMESKEIAKELFMSSHTVDNHRRNMLARTGARDTTALVQLCHMAGIIEL